MKEKVQTLQDFGEILHEVRNSLHYKTDLLASDLKASKRFRDQDASNESIDITVGKQDYASAMEALQSVGHESIIQDQQVLDAFGCDSVRVKNIIMTRAPGNQLVSEKGNVSIFGALFDHK